MLGKQDCYNELSFYDRNLILHPAISYYKIIYIEWTYFDRVYVVPGSAVFWRVLKRMKKKNLCDLSSICV